MTDLPAIYRHPLGRITPYPMKCPDRIVGHSERVVRVFQRTFCETRRGELIRSNSGVSGMQNLNTGVAGKSGPVERQNGSETMYLHGMAATSRASCAGFPVTRY